MYVRRMIGCLLLLIGFSSAVSVQGFATVSATTGGTATTPAAYTVPAKIAALYPGQYALQSVARGARLSHGQMAIDLNSLGYLQGIIQFRGYNPRGFQTTWLAAVYNFHLTAPNSMTIGLYGPKGTPLLGYLYVQRTKQGDLVGQIALPRTRYAIRWHKNTSL